MMTFYKERGQKQTWKAGGAEWASRSMSMVFPTPTPPCMYSPGSLLSCAFVGAPVIKRVNLHIQSHHLPLPSIAIQASTEQQPEKTAEKCKNEVYHYSSLQEIRVRLASNHARATRVWHE